MCLSACMQACGGRLARQAAAFDLLHAPASPPLSRSSLLGEYDFNMSEYMVVLDKPVGLTLAPDPRSGRVSSRAPPARAAAWTVDRPSRAPRDPAPVPRLRAPAPPPPGRRCADTPVLGGGCRYWCSMCTQGRLQQPPC